MGNKYILIYILIFLSHGKLTAQESMKKALEKLCITENELIKSNESIFLFPTGFLYSTDQPDSIVYLGCLSTDQSTFLNYFEKKNETFLFPSGSKIMRQVGDTTYTILMENLTQKINHLNNPSFINSSAKHLLFYYWNPQILDKHLIKNYSFFKKYSKKHAEFKIQVIPLLVD